MSTNNQTKLSPNHFTPGFAFELKTVQHPEKWERITIHQNCDVQLIKEVRRIFKREPELFRRVNVLT
jgi:hypothetical protein